MQVGGELVKCDKHIHKHIHTFFLSLLDKYIRKRNIVTLSEVNHSSKFQNGYVRQQHFVFDSTDQRQTVSAPHNNRKLFKQIISKDWFCHISGMINK